MKKEEFELEGYKVEIIDFGYAKYMYPTFNGNAEFEVNKQGFKKLRHYLRFLNWTKQHNPFLNEEA